MFVSLSDHFCKTLSGKCTTNDRATFDCVKLSLHHYIHRLMFIQNHSTYCFVGCSPRINSPLQAPRTQVVACAKETGLINQYKQLLEGQVVISKTITFNKRSKFVET